MVERNSDSGRPRKYANSRQAEADDYRYWQSRSGQERMDAVAELTLTAYAMKTGAPPPYVQDYKDLLSAFHAPGVKYLIVGGYAVSFHSQPRATKDIDLFIRPDPVNARAVYAALAAFGLPLKGIQVEDLADRSGFLRFGTQPMAIDILPEIPGVEFDAAWERRAESVLDASTGLKAFYLSKDDRRQISLRPFARPRRR